MKSQNVIMVLCWIALILDWTTIDVLPHPDLATAMIWSWLIMWLFGFFKREEANATGPVEEDERSQRQKDFMRKLEAGKIADDDVDAGGIEARIVTQDEDGEVSSVIIKEDGTIETEGNPDPDIVAAAGMLKEAIKTHGPEAIAEELAKQIAAMKKDKD